MNMGIYSAYKYTGVSRYAFRVGINKIPYIPLFNISRKILCLFKILGVK